MPVINTVPGVPAWTPEGIDGAAIRAILATQGSQAKRGEPPPSPQPRGSATVGGAAPDHPQPIGLDPLILLIHESAVTAKAEETIKALLQSVELAGLHLNNCSQLTMTIEPLLISQGELHKADRPKGNQTNFHSQREGTADHLPALGLELEVRGNARSISRTACSGDRWTTAKRSA